MIKIERIGKTQFVVRADRPCRVEVTALPNGNLVAFAYPGVKDDKDQEPVAVFDSTFDVVKSEPLPEPVTAEEKREAFMRAARGLSANQTARAFNRLTPGIDWRGCNKGYIADHWARPSCHPRLGFIRYDLIVKAFEEART